MVESADAAELTVKLSDDLETLREIGSKVDDLDGSNHIEGPDVTSVEEVELVTKA